MKELVVGETVLELCPMEGFGISQAFIMHASFLTFKPPPKKYISLAFN
jgi:hypothetical protein